MPIYLQTDKIKGPVTTKKFKNALELHEVKTAAEIPISMMPGKELEWISRGLHCDSIQCTRKPDGVSTQLFGYLGNRSLLPEVTITFCTLGNGGKPYLAYILENALLARYAMAGTAEMLREVWTLAFETIRLEYTHYKTDGNSIENISRAGYDIPKAQRT